jgi:hypothetical protein
MDFRLIVKTFFFLAAIGWGLLNVAGLFMAQMQDAGWAHLGTHIGLAVLLFGVAYFIRPWKKSPKPAEPALRDARLEVLENEVSHLQKELHETKRSLDFTEQLLAQKNEPLPRNDS